MEKITTKSEQLMLPLEKIKPNPLNTFGEDRFEDLKNSIATYGLISPISVIGPNDEGNYTLIAGEQRLHVFEALKEEIGPEFAKIPAYVLGDMSMSETEQQLLIEASNLDTRDSFDKHAHYLNVVKLMQQLASEENMKKSEYVKMRNDYMKCSPRYARFYEQIFNSGNEELQDLVTSGEVSVSRAGRIATLDKEAQEEAIADIKSGMNQDEVVRKQTAKRKADFDIPDNEVDMFDSFGKNEDFDSEDQEYKDPFKVSENFEIDDIDDIDFGAFDTNTLKCNSVGEEKGTSKEVKSVIAWCEKMKKVTKPSDEEWEALEACRTIVNKFF